MNFDTVKILYITGILRYKTCITDRLTDTATENGVSEAGSCRHCSSHSSVALSIAADQCCDVFCTPLLQYWHPKVTGDETGARVIFLYLIDVLM